MGQDPKSLKSSSLLMMILVFRAFIIIVTVIEVVVAASTPVVAILVKLHVIWISPLSHLVGSLSHLLLSSLLLNKLAEVINELKL